MAQYYTTMNLKSRFAPSPTGYLHLGNARTALFAWLAARAVAGRFVLRLEDTDQSRSPQMYEKALLEDLRWLGLNWDEGPDIGGPVGPYRQMERLDTYHQYYEALLAAGQAYPCYCSAEDLAAERAVQRASGKAPRYGGRCRHLSVEQRRDLEARGIQPVLRYRVPDSGMLTVPDRVWGERSYALADLGDFVIRRSDGSPAFFFANALDDALMGVNLVLRGEDHLSNTPRQILILQALDLPIPEYAHLPLLLGSDGQPLSKRHGAASLRDLQIQGYRPEAARNYLARLGHHYAESDLLDDQALAAGFSVAKISRAPGHFDDVQLQHWQRLALQALSGAQLWEWLRAANLSSVENRLLEKMLKAVSDDENLPIKFVAAVRANVLFPEEALDWARRCFADETFAELEKEDAALVALAETPAEFWPLAAMLLQQSAGDYKIWTKTLQQESGLKGKSLFMPLRAALTGRSHGPELAALLPLIGMERAQQRLLTAASVLSEVRK
ncbi:glutamate--tRNA ligase [Acidithiobacillus thiooxidans]|uniref:Glutamate--tRNA ligase n=1 Tax=Acidithiobacillus thiooxidans ATCC 19377 TaxID=637390 RepID=A0A543Q305_ACITH|nr:glutamate--tRNA ligase [Acidithiobacillus thiooxidans]MDR7927412.1 glutamate--tRNA ligase [Acidithiobacillus thiooxidans]MDX5935151.1 glutamate--tRNA ligase [Acidithiobacillus thiooxidans]TQN50717.1 Glutamate--tRNA ligase 2 [Acidithiobacillus thiooxidans ATCC 19377]